MSIIVALLVYGSLYPWEFNFDPSVRPTAKLLASWHETLTVDFPGRDFAVNIAIYLPLGLVGFLAFRSWVRVLLLAGILSVAIELAQAYQPVRVSSPLDTIANLAGAVAGVILAGVFRRTLDSLHERWLFYSQPRQVPLALVACWAATVLFPLFPELSRARLLAKLARFAQEPFLLVPFLSWTVVFFTLGRLLSASGIGSPVPWLAGAVLLVPASILMQGAQPSPGAIAGAASGWVAFALAGRRRHVAAFTAILFVGLIAYRGLWPFEWQPYAGRFQWIPFGGVLEVDNWQRSLGILLEKMFYYATSIWTLEAAGLGLWRSAALIAVILGGIEAVQMWLPGRTPELTDPVLAILTAFLLHAGSEPPAAGV